MPSCFCNGLLKWRSEKGNGLDRPHTQEVPIKCHQASPWLESTRKAKSRKTATDLAQDHCHRGEGDRNNMYAAEEDLTEPSALQECCCGPTSLRESKGLSILQKLCACPAIYPSPLRMSAETQGYSHSPVTAHCRNFAKAFNRCKHSLSRSVWTLEPLI